MEVSLAGRVALVTGGSRGLGFAAAKRLAASGAEVALVARGEEALMAARDEIAAVCSTKLEAFVCDVSDDASVRAAHGRIEQAFGRVDVLFNNAGTHAHDDFLKLTDEAWQADLDLKLYSNIRFSRLVMPGMCERRWGRIINTVNTMAKAPGAFTAPTSVSRAAQMALTKVLAGEGGPHNLLVNAVAIGMIDSAQIRRLYETSDRTLSYEEFTREIAATRKIPLSRIGRAEELANVVCFLASEAASYVTGTVINVDGGACPVY